MHFASVFFCSPTIRVFSSLYAACNILSFHSDHPKSFLPQLLNSRAFILTASNVTCQLPHLDPNFWWFGGNIWSQVDSGGKFHHLLLSSSEPPSLRPASTLQPLTAPQPSLTLLGCFVVSRPLPPPPPPPLLFHISQFFPHRQLVRFFFFNVSVCSIKRHTQAKD